MHSPGIPWTGACQVPLSMEFSRQEYWSGLLFPSSGDLPHPGIEPRSPTLQVYSLPAEPQGKPIIRKDLGKFSKGSYEASKQLKITSIYIRETFYWKYKTGEMHFYRNHPELSHCKGSCYVLWITMMKNTIVSATIKKMPQLKFTPPTPVMKIWSVYILAFL